MSTEDLSAVRVSRRPDSIYAIAFVCEPGGGSEEGVGWAFAKAIGLLGNSLGVPVTIVTSQPHTCHVAKALGETAGLTIQPTVRSVWLPAWVLRLKSEWLLRVCYCFWQLLATRTIARDMRRNYLLGTGGDTIVHHLTYATEVIPTFEGRLTRYGAWVLGPAGSASQSSGDLPVGSFFRLRRYLRGLLLRVNCAADVAIATNQHSYESWRSWNEGPRTDGRYLEPNVMLDPDELPEAVPFTDRLFDVVIVGHLRRRKRVDLALQVAAHTGRSLKVGVVGDGPERLALQIVADHLPNLDTHFLGRHPRSETLRIIANSRTLLHTSAQEGSPWVVGEAQSLGTVPVVIPGTGSDTIVKLGGLGFVATRPSEDALSEALCSALDTKVEPERTYRWHESRMPDLLHQWYTAALEIAASRRLRG